VGVLYVGWYSPLETAMPMTFPPRLPLHPMRQLHQLAAEVSREEEALRVAAGQLTQEKQR
jgi:hypothetical protein